MTGMGSPEEFVVKLQSVCVYCGSRVGARDSYMDAARTLGRALAEAEIELVYGGGDIGLMGAVANAVVDGGGMVTGVLPRFLRDVEIPSHRIRELVITETMHDRKALMFERSDAFCVLPGGIGTLEEMVEMMSWAYLRQHTKPIVLVNLGGFWDPFIALVDHMITEGFAHEDMPKLWQVVTRVEDVLPAMRKWLDRAAHEAAPKF